MRLWMRDEARTESDWNTFKRSTPSSLKPAFIINLSICPGQWETRPNLLCREKELLTNLHCHWTRSCRFLISQELQTNYGKERDWIWGVFMYFVSPAYIFCEGVPSLHSHTSGLSWSGPNYHSSNRPALPSPALPAIEHPPFFASTSCEIEEKPNRSLDFQLTLYFMPSALKPNDPGPHPSDKPVSYMVST